MKVPFRSVCGDEPVCALLVRTWSLFVQRWTGHGRQIPTTFAISCNRPTTLWASQPSLLSCSLLSSFLLRFSHVSHSFSNFPSLFSLLSFLLFFSTIFQQLSFRFFQRFFFFGLSDASPCDPFVSNVPHEEQDTETNAGMLNRSGGTFKKGY